MKDPMTLAYVNLYALLGALPHLCALDAEAQRLIADTNMSVGFSVKGGPAATLVFSHGACTLREGVAGAKIRASFATPERFNGMIDGTVTPLSPSVILHASFMTKTFTALTDRLAAYLRPAEGALDDPEFFRISTTLMLHVIAGAIAQLGNHDSVSRASASYIVDGQIRLDVTGGPSAAVMAKDHHLTVCEPTDDYFSYMRFDSMQTARDLFDGKINAVVAVGIGQVRVGGMISQIDNVNRILDRVAVYLA